MIKGIGVDIVDVSRFESWIKDENIINRFFNATEMCQGKSMQHQMEHYAARFAAKEAFGKALGIGITGFSLKDIYVQKDESGKPFLVIQDSAKKVFEEIIGKGDIQISLSHEKNNAIAFVIIQDI